MISGGPLQVKSYPALVGDDGTFVLKGEKASLIIEGNAQVNLKAPDSGAYAGLVFYQALGKVMDYPHAESYIKSGAGISITGTAYFPTQLFEFTSDKPSKMQAPTTSFIAYKVRFKNDAMIDVHVDHETAGLPLLLPRSDEGARLIQ